MCCEREVTPERALENGYRRVVPRDAVSNIVPGLWMSGSRAALESGRFDRVLTLCRERDERVAVPAGSEALAWRIPDAQIEDPEQIRSWARRIAGWIADGETVLVRCAAGLNRSGLVVARTLVEQGYQPAEAVGLVRERRRTDALNNPWFLEWLRHESAKAGPRAFAPAPPIPLPSQTLGVQPFTRTFGLDRAELVSTAVAVVVSTTLFLVVGEPYLARGVVGDLLGFVVLSVPLVAAGRRLRHEAMICLAGIGLVHATGADWPLRWDSATHWTAFTLGLAGYLALRWARVPSKLPGLGIRGARAERAPSADR